MSWDANKSLDGYVGMGVEKGRVDMFNDIKGKNIIEFGYGSGDLLKYLETRGNKVTGVDCSSANYYTAKSKGVQGSLLKLDVSKERLPFLDGDFDVVFAFEILEHLSDPIHFLNEAKRIAKEDAIFFISHPIPSKIEGYKFGRHAFNYPGLFEKENFDRFLMQMSFKFDKYLEDSYHAFYKLFNKRYHRMNILDVINLDIDGVKHYSDLNWDIKIEPVDKGPHD